MPWPQKSGREAFVSSLTSVGSDRPPSTPPLPLRVVEQGLRSLGMELPALVLAGLVLLSLVMCTVVFGVDSPSYAQLINSRQLLYSVMPVVNNTVLYT